MALWEKIKINIKIQIQMKLFIPVIMRIFIIQVPPNTFFLENALKNSKYFLKFLLFLFPSG